MGKFRHTFRRWHAKSLLAKHVDLGLIAAEVHGGCMGLPQEIVDRIIDILQNDMTALKACSLTCKAMFASTRHLIHQTLHLTKEVNQRIFTPEERVRYEQGDRRELELRFLSFMGERGLLKYARYLDIRIGVDAPPDILEPHLQYFQSLDRIHTLTIHSYESLLCRDVYSTYFAQFYPTLTTLVLYFPIDHNRFTPWQFVSQFPNLKNLTLESLWDETRVWTGTQVPPVVAKFPPLRGHLRCAGPGAMIPVWKREFFFDLPNSLNFRSVELQGIYWARAQKILDGCVSSLEELTVHVTGNGRFELGKLQFQETTSLRSIVLRAQFSGLPPLAVESFWKRLSIMTFPALSTFVLELVSPPPRSTQRSLDLWGDWDDIDRLFRSFLLWRPDFRLVIRTGTLSDRDEFEAHVKERFPLMAGRELIRFETFPALDKYWS